MLLRVGRADDQVLRDRVGLILPLALLVLDDAPLLVEPGLRERAKEVAHPIGLEPQDRVERFLGYGLEVVGAIGAGRAVLARGANLARGLEEVVVEVLAPLEHQVFEEVREAGLPARFVLRPDVYQMFKCTTGAFVS